MFPLSYHYDLDVIILSAAGVHPKTCAKRRDVSYLPHRTENLGDGCVSLRRSEIVLAFVPSQMSHGMDSGALAAHLCNSWQ